MRNQTLYTDMLSSDQKTGILHFFSFLTFGNTQVCIKNGMFNKRQLFCQIGHMTD